MLLLILLTVLCPSHPNVPTTTSSKHDVLGEQ